MNYDEKCQLLIIGDSTVGKTSLLYRFTDNKFSTQYLATVGIDFFTKDEEFDGKIVRIKIWDTAGQERYKSLTQGFFRNAHGIILAYDVTNQETFDNLKYWIQSIHTQMGDATTKLIIVGNKIDLPREVKKEEAQKFALESHFPYYETSAKTGEGINESIRTLVKMVFHSKNNSDDKDKDKITLNKKASKNLDDEPKKCSC